MTTLLDLGTQPLVNNLCATKEESLNAKRYRLRAEMADDMLINLDAESTVPPEELYEHYLYRSGVNIPYVKHCEDMAQLFVSSRRGTVIDVGGNDGTLLKAFRRTMGIQNLINVDASSSMRADNESAGIKYVEGYFNHDMDLPTADVITSTNVFQHTSDVHKFLAAIVKHLHDDGIWLLEFPYTLNTLKTLQFDQFYHEHYYYWLMTPLIKLLSTYQLEVVHVEEHYIHGGSLRLLIRKDKDTWHKFDYARYVEREIDFDYQSWNEKVNHKIKTDKEIIKNLDGTVAFFGAAAKGCVYMNALNLQASDKYLYIVDDTPAKEGKWMPGVGLQVVARDTLTYEKPDNLIILAHNFKDHIIKSLGDYDGNIITMYGDEHGNI
jgi:2-polyprenyl-3-methyl-5-hydroxy-6-metoxy-1,4-benzoquinol methylase